MKIRIKGNSVRYRLTKSDVSKLAATGYLEEYTSFGASSLTYALERKENIRQLEADFRDNKISLFVPASFLADWPLNDVIGTDTKFALPGNGSLYLLLEKDFVCLDETQEDQSDNYENPNKTC
jgi:hypothetical protein